VENLKHTIDLAHKVCQMCEAKLVSRQYLVAANLMICSANLGLATHQTGAEKKELIKNALAASQAAVDVYQDFGFIQIIETSSEEVLYTHSLALAAAGEQSASAIYLERSYNEMMRKYSLIPEEQHFRHTYLKNIKLHQEIWQAYQAMTASAVQTKDAPVAGK
jgi:hypothetical protein